MGKVKYDQPFMDHNGWKKAKIFTEKKNGCKVSNDRPLVNYDRPFMGIARN